MKILVDENIPRITVEGLRAVGHDVKDVRGTAMQAVVDSALWQMAMAEGRLFITTDKGFTAYRATQHHGILVVRLRQPNRHKIDNAVTLALGRFRDIDWPGLLVVVRDQTISVSRTSAP